MEVYLRLGLLCVVALLLLLLLVIARSKQKQLKSDNVYAEYREPSLTLTPVQAKTPPSMDSPLTPQDLIMLSVVAKPGERFASYELLQAISAAGLEFGEMNIFHYYIHTSKGQTALFSLSSATEPGEFDLDHIGDFSCAGLTLFMDMRKAPDPVEAFQLMLTAAEQLVEDLDGLLRAGQRHPWSEETKQQLLSKATHYHNLQSA